MDDLQKKHRQVMFKESNAATITYSEKAVLYAFYLNGAASTALLARADASFYPAAASFGWGAFWAVVCIGLSYVYQLLITQTWSGETPPISIRVQLIFEFNIKSAIVEKLRAIPILTWCFAMVQFIRGIAQLSI